jgi:hypothetical protein
MPTKPQSSPPAGLLLAALALLALCASSLRAEEVFVTSKIGTADGEDGACPPSCTTGSVSSSGSSAVSTAVPPPVIPASARKARFGYADGCTWAVTPTDITQTSSSGTWTFQSLPCINWYRIYITKGTSINCSTNLLVTMTVDTATALYDLNNNLVTCLSLNQFQAAQPNNVWIPVGFISNTTPNPTVTFTWASGSLSPTARWYMDAVRFDTIYCPPTPAKITEILYGNPITLSGTGSVGHLFALVSSTNAARALNLWTPEQICTECTGSFTFSVVPGTEKARFFRVITQ